MRERTWKEEVPREAVLTPGPVEKAVPLEGCHHCGRSCPLGRIIIALHPALPPPVILRVGRARGKVKKET